MSKVPVLTFLASILSIGAVAQSPHPSCSPGGNFGSQSLAIMRTGVGTPYSLTATVKTEMKLSGGNTISGFVTSRQLRDGQGRTRVDAPSFCATDVDHQLHWEGSITLTDPFFKTYTFWQDKFVLPSKRVFVTYEPDVKASNPPTAQDEYRTAVLLSRSSDHAGPQAQQFRVEDLGKRTIAGLQASGMRITRTLPPGTEGNSLPLTYVEEKWISDEYNIFLLDIKDDPISGVSAYEVTSFALGEPDASLFQPPAGYVISELTVTQ